MQMNNKQVKQVLSDRRPVTTNKENTDAFYNINYHSNRSVGISNRLFPVETYCLQTGHLNATKHSKPYYLFIYGQTVFIKPYPFLA